MYQISPTCIRIGHRKKHPEKNTKKSPDLPNLKPSNRSREKRYATHTTMLLKQKFDTELFAGEGGRHTGLSVSTTQPRDVLLNWAVN